MLPNGILLGNQQEVLRDQEQKDPGHHLDEPIIGCKRKEVTLQRTEAQHQIKKAFLEQIESCVSNSN